MKTRFFTSVAALALVAGTAQAQDLLFPVGEGDFNWDSYQAFADATDLSGQTVTITGPWTGLDAELFESMAAYFEAATGATVEYSGSDSFEQDIVIATQADSPPNIAVFPQPGLMTDLAAQGELAAMGRGYRRLDRRKLRRGPLLGIAGDGGRAGRQTRFTASSTRSM
jgi:alpha-glucoside transport system substrate-binding protein